MANIAFVYGCLSTILYMVVHLVVAVLGRPELIFSHENSNLWFGLGTLHILVLGFTFGPYGSGPAYEFGWPTLIDPTENAVRTGRIVVGLAAGNLVYWFVQVFRIRGDHEAASVLSAIALLFAVILAATWGLRLENLVSPFYVAAPMATQPRSCPVP